MNFSRNYKALRWLRPHATFLAIAVGALSTLHDVNAANNVVLWDTSARLSELVDPKETSGWKAVPADIVALEADPAKAASDPGYWGREYAFKGDAAVETPKFTAVFISVNGHALIYSKTDGTPTSARPSLGRKLVELVLTQTSTPKIRNVEILRNAADEVALKVAFVENGSAAATATFMFGRSEIVEIKPSPTIQGMSVVSGIEYGIAPNFIGDDLIFRPSDYSQSDKLFVPAQSLFLGLLAGEEDLLVLTWPKGKQQLRLRSGADAQGQRRFQAIDFDPDGQSFYLAPLSAHGIWHKEELKPAYLEKDTTIQWKPPFPAKWKTQLTEAGVRTTFNFRQGKGSVWRGVAGNYTYPVWIDKDQAFFHLSKKLPPRDESIIYFVEGQDTPLSISTPVDILKATLGRAACEPLLDIAGRKLRTHHRRGGEGVHRACTCGCTEAIQALFEKGEEITKKKDVEQAIDDMIFFVQNHVDRIDEYRRFADAMTKFLQSKESLSPDVKAYVQSLQQIVEQIPQEYGVQKENMKSLDYAGQLTRQTMALTTKKDPNNLKSYMDLLKAWRGMGGAQDYVLAQCHMITRKLAQEAGYEGVKDAKTAALAAEIGARCRQMLRSPDSYEIWGDY